MKETNYWADSKKYNANSRLPSCVAKNYYVPSINKILTAIKPDDPDFIPVYFDDSKADIKANIPEKELKINKGGHAIIDCGFYLEVPSGYKISVSTKINYLNNKVFVRDIINDNNRIKILVINSDENVVTISHKDTIGQIYIEPIYFFEWGV